MPLGDRVLIKADPKTEQTTASGIITNDSVKRGTTIFGEVIMVGPGVHTQSGTLIPMTIKKGDLVLYKKDMAGDPIKIDDEDYVLFREHDLLMVDSK